MVLIILIIDFSVITLHVILVDIINIIIIGL